MKIFITGIAGFIGSHMAEKLASLGHEVYGIDNFSPYYNVAFKQENARVLRGKGITIIEGDLVTDDLTNIIVDDTAYIYHFAAQPGISSQVPPEDYVRNNITATEKLLARAVTLPNLRMFVNIATSSVYGKMAVGNEKTPPTPASKYGETKLAAEQMVLSLVKQGKLNACSIRPFSVYGPRERPEKMCFKFIESLIDATEFPLFIGSRQHRRSFTYVGDLVNALAAIISHEKEVRGEIFNIGDPHSVSVDEVLTTIEQLFGSKGIFVEKPARAGDQDETKAVIEKARSILKFEPKTALAEGLKHQIDWQRARRKLVLD